MSPTPQDLLTSIGTHAASLVEDGMVAGLGTGSTAAAMIDALGARVQQGLHVTAVATSNQSRRQAESYGIPVVELADVDRIDICIDGADEIDPHLNLVKGRGGALLFEKLVARQADHYVIIATADKCVERLGTRMPLPVEIIPTGWNHTAAIIRTLGLEPTLRTEGDRMYTTDGDHGIVDCVWPQEAIDPARLASEIKAITGVVDHGLFIDMADHIITIDQTGIVHEQRR